MDLQNTINYITIGVFSIGTLINLVRLFKEVR